MRRHARDQEHRAFRREAEDIDREIAAPGRRDADRSLPGHGSPRSATKSSTGFRFSAGFRTRTASGAIGWSSSPAAVWRPPIKDVAGGYVDIFDLTTPADLAARNAQRRSEGEGGGQKQSATSAFDEELLRAARLRLGLGDVSGLPSIADVPAVQKRVAREPAVRSPVAAHSLCRVFWRWSG